VIRAWQARPGRGRRREGYVGLDYLEELYDTSESADSTTFLHTLDEITGFAGWPGSGRRCSKLGV
jgi:hypothetical protein